MKLSTQPRRFNPDDELLACFDVSKATLNLFSRVEQIEQIYCLEDQIPNTTDAIEQLLTRLSDFARQAERPHLRVLCEPTGGYEHKLLHTARRLGHRTALISAEHVAQLKTVESNDTGKTDRKDPRVMHLVARLGKMQQDRRLPEPYRCLRRLTAYYGFSPYRMARAGYSRFERKMKGHVRGVRFATLAHLFACAEQAVRYAHTRDEITVLEGRAAALWTDSDWVYCAPELG